MLKSWLTGEKELFQTVCVEIEASETSDKTGKIKEREMNTPLRTKGMKDAWKV